jgi:hypothetical protein
MLAQLTDATLLAKAMEWAALNERCHGEVFNITNGDVFRWSQLFPVIAETLAIDLAEPQPIRLVDAMKAYEPVWQRMTERDGLRNHRLDALANWLFGDVIFNVEHDAFFESRSGDAAWCSPGARRPRPMRPPRRPALQVATPTRCAST